MFTSIKRFHHFDWSAYSSRYMAVIRPIGMQISAVRLMTQAAAKELAQSGVRINSIAPGWISTDLNAYLKADQGSMDLAVSMIPAAAHARSPAVNSGTAAGNGGSA